MQLISAATLETLAFARSLAATTAGNTVTLSAEYFTDATYEGDLMAVVGIPYRVGREARDEFDESLAP